MLTTYDTYYSVLLWGQQYASRSGNINFTECKPEQKCVVNPSPDQQEIHFWPRRYLFEHVNEFFLVYGTSSPINLHLIKLLEN